MREPIRLQKHLSQENICSRRKAEAYMQKGWILVNGVPATLGCSVTPGVDEISFSEEMKKELSTQIILAFYKPRGVVTNLPQDDEKEITDILPTKFSHLSSVGRLDKDSEGLILMTDDGTYAKKMLDPKNPHRRTYIVSINKQLSEDDMDLLSDGIFLKGKKTRQVEIYHIQHQTYELVLYEGKNRQIRKMMTAVGAHVLKLKRVQFGPYDLDELRLKAGEFKIIKD